LQKCDLSLCNYIGAIGPVGTGMDLTQN